MTIQCSDEGNYNFPEVDHALDCPYNGYPCLFDLDADPCEYADLRESEPEIYEKMLDLLMEYNATQKMPTLYSTHPSDDIGANPSLFGGFWSPWKETDLSFNQIETVEWKEMVLDVVEQSRGIRGIMENVSMNGVIPMMFFVMTIALILLHHVCWHRRSYKEIRDSSSP